MAILLNLIVLIICLILIFKSDKNNGFLMMVSLLFILGTVVCFILAMAFEHEYLDGLNHIIVSAASSLLFWLVSMLLILFQTGKKFSPIEKISKILTVGIVLFIPLFVYSLITTASFKIGG
ncbi:MAG: hypothetical protein IT222_11865 [Crocinitomix sp.]|nr:hypothetical protein [Crocinitomix sp.]